MPQALCLLQAPINWSLHHKPNKWVNQNWALSALSHSFSKICSTKIGGQFYQFYRKKTWYHWYNLPEKHWNIHHPFLNSPPVPSGKCNPHLWWNGSTGLWRRCLVVFGFLAPSTGQFMTCSCVYMHSLYIYIPRPSIEHKFPLV